ncbi:MAG: GLPGLI family protein [Bacteroidetes bacterium]|nr:GLPGLI family protein [Bacteroidota bacterium]
MKKTIIFIFHFFICFYYSQNFKIDYQLLYKEDSLSAEISNKNMVLLVQGKQSKFLTSKQFTADSLSLSKSKTQILGDYSFLVVNHENNLSYKYYYYLKDIYRTKEIVELKWKILPETKTIDGYHCTKAFSNYKGRKWTAWFTQDLPIQAGPYIFRNLPGMIIYLEDSTGSYRFILKSILKNPDNVDFENEYKNALTISQKKLQKLFLEYYADPLKELKLEKEDTKFVDENGKEIKPDYREITKTIQTNLKKHNNPIELSEAVKYPDK